jgi:hypothetical protein
LFFRNLEKQNASGVVFEQQSVCSSQGLERPAGKESDVRLIVFIMPAFKGNRGFVMQLRHNADPSSGLYQVQELFKFFMRSAQVLHGFGTG